LSTQILVFLGYRVLIAALFTIVKLWKQPRCPTTDEGASNEENVVSTYNRILFSHKENEILTFAGKWMELENINLSEVSQAQNAKGCMFSLICGV
jgi:hypothetical protein